MKKNNIVVLENRNGLVTKAFAKQARIFGTPEYKLWREFLKDNEDAEMEIRTVKKNTQSEKYCKNLTYKNMEEHIETFNDENLMDEFKKELVRSKVQVNPYKYMVNWFKATFPNYKEIQKSFDKEIENDENSNKTIKISV